MIEITISTLTDELKKRIYDGFGRHALFTVGSDEKADPVAFIAQDKNGEFVGAAVVEMFWGALHIKYVYVEESYRKQGIGTNLMERVFSYGQKNKCPFVFVETMSFQAMGFYQKMGFELEFTRSGYSRGTSFHYLKKDFYTCSKIEKDEFLMS